MFYDIKLLKTPKLDKESKKLPQAGSVTVSNKTSLQQLLRNS